MESLSRLEDPTKSKATPRGKEGKGEKKGSSITLDPMPRAIGKRGAAFPFFTHYSRQDREGKEVKSLDRGRRQKRGKDLFIVSAS